MDLKMVLKTSNYWIILRMKKLDMVIQTKVSELPFGTIDFLAHDIYCKHDVR